jgi:pyruvate dehydrogenase E2 component (dihydrolipoamide acetyltransferase)
MSNAGPGQPLHGVRRAMAQKMEQSHAEIVPASVYDEADVEDWIENGDITVRADPRHVAGCRLADAERLVQRRRTRPSRHRKDPCRHGDQHR